ncbi:hypothetical protein F5880DRAFT_1220620 [Lentinula raphanica]|nr:hypothetical protein F5880DRAFT_1220620 [Lentinula raphanica]
MRSKHWQPAGRKRCQAKRLQALSPKRQEAPTGPHPLLQPSLLYSPLSLVTGSRGARDFVFKASSFKSDYSSIDVSQRLVQDISPYLFIIRFCSGSAPKFKVVRKASVPKRITYVRPTSSEPEMRRLEWCLQGQAKVGIVGSETNLGCTETTSS